MHLPKSLNLDSTGSTGDKRRSQMHHKEVTPTYPGSETSVAVGTISFITDDAGKKKRIQVRMERQRGHLTKHSRWILSGSFLRQIKCETVFSETRGDIRVQLAVWRYSETVTCVRCLVSWFCQKSLLPSPSPCLELHMEVFRGKMMKCQEFSLMYCRKKREKRKEWGDVSVRKCWSLLNPGDGSLLYN